MKICRLRLERAGVVLAAVEDDDQVKPLRSNRVINIRSVRQDYIDSWAMLKDSLLRSNFYESVLEIAARSEPIGTLAELQEQGRLLSPVDRQEVWAAGVTYQ